MVRVHAARVWLANRGQGAGRGPPSQLSWRPSQWTSELVDVDVVQAVEVDRHEVAADLGQVPLAVDEIPQLLQQDRPVEQGKAIVNLPMAQALAEVGVTSRRSTSHHAG